MKRNILHKLWQKQRTPYSGFHFLCSKLRTLADASSFGVKLCRMWKKSVVVCPPPQFQKESEKEARFLANPLSSLPPFAGATLGCYNVTNPQFTLDLLWVLMGYNSVPLGRAYSRFSLSVWLLAVVRLAFTNKIRLTGREMLLCLCWSLFQKLTAVKQAKFGAAKNFYCYAYAKLVCYAISRFLAVWWKFVCRTRLYPIFPKHFVLFVWLYLERRLSSQNTNLTTIFDRVFSSFMYTFYSQFSTRTDRKSVAKRAGCWKNLLFFCAKDLIYTVRNKWDHSKALLKIWSESDKRAILFFKQKKRT